MNFWKILAFSIVETVGLAAGLPLHDLLLLGFLVWWLGFIVEHWFSHNTAHGKSLFNTAGIPFGKIIAFSFTEAVWWEIWLYLANVPVIGLPLAAVFLSLILIPQHSIEFNVVEGRPFFANLFNPKSVLISVIEGVGGTIWLVLAQMAVGVFSVLGIIAILELFLTMEIEHIYQAKNISLKEGQP